MSSRLAQGDEIPAEGGPSPGAQEGPAEPDQDVQEARDALRAAAKAVKTPQDALEALFELFGRPPEGGEAAWAAAFGDQDGTVELLLRGEISSVPLAQVTLRMIAKDVQGVARRLIEAAEEKESAAAMDALSGPAQFPPSDGVGQVHEQDCPDPHEIRGVHVTCPESLEELDEQDDDVDTEHFVFERASVEAAPGAAIQEAEALPEDRYWSSPAGVVEDGEYEATIKDEWGEHVVRRRAGEPVLNFAADAAKALEEDRAERDQELATAFESDSEFLHRIAGALEAAEPDLDTYSQEAWRLHEIAERLAVQERGAEDERDESWAAHVRETLERLAILGEAATAALLDSSGIKVDRGRGTPERGDG